MAGISRRYFMGASLGAAVGAEAQANTDIANAIPDTPASGRVLVADFGALGNCHRFGSTNGASDDSDAIEAALRACPDGGVVQFTPGRCYMVGRAIHVTGKSLTLDMRGATLRCGDDSVWHVFLFGGVNPETPVETVTVLGGIWDGNLAHQRYWPNSNGTTVFTDAGIEPAGAERGRVFYDNSPINGTLWKHGWLDGSAGDGINVNGRGNRGLVRVQHTRNARFLHCRARDFVRNGFVTWNCEDSLFFDCHGSGQLPSTYFELKALFGRGFEAAFIKVVGDNKERRPLRGTHGTSARVIGGRVIGGAMPFFMRIQGKKPVSSASFCQITGFEAHGIAREVWFEDCAVVRISDSSIICHEAAASRFRNDPAIFFSNRTHDWVISNCYVRGRINTNQNQDRRFGVIESSILDCPAPLEDWVVICDRISNSVVQCGGWGAVCRMAINSEFLAERNASLKVTETMRGCQIGARRLSGPTERLRLHAGADSVTLAGAPAGINHVRIRNADVMGGRWFDIHKSRYRLKRDVLQIRDTEGPFAARAGDEIEVSWYRPGSQLAPYAGLRIHGGSEAGACVDALVQNTRMIRIDGTCRMTGRCLDMSDATVLHLGKGASLDLRDLTVIRAAGSLLATQRGGAARQLSVRGCWFEDWGRQSEIFGAETRRPMAGIWITDLLQVTQTTFLYASPDQDDRRRSPPGTNRGKVALLIEGDNVHAGGATPPRFAAERSMRKPDFSEG